MTQRVRLRDGSEVVIRPLLPADRDAYLDTVRRVGEESRRRRFLGPKPSLSEAEIRYFVEVDHHDHEALIAFDALTGRGLGVARFIRERRDPSSADSAVTVVDAAQGHGLGGVLLARIAERAREEGVEHLHADVALDNRPMLEMLRHRGARARPCDDWPGVRCFDIPLTA
ncbi:MAG TPA: GNAT family N-acetyltransferase [Candidatus Dormibacteraeota bacterium]|nr:GNAT family N-acetyltransferase [Candidatus Dormibacteraeota bacterium]